MSRLDNSNMYYGTLFHYYHFNSVSRSMFVPTKL